MDDMTPFEDRFEERVRTFARSGVPSVDSASIARAMAVGHPKRAGTRPARRRLLDEIHRNRKRAVSRTTLAAAAIVAVVALGGALAAFGGPSPTPSANPSPSLPGVVAPSSTPNATASDSSAVPRSTGVWIATGTMGTPRYGQVVRLLDGRVLVVGGSNGDENDTSAELYDPGSGTWSATGNMLKRQGGFPATLLRDGRVLVGDGDDPNADDPARWKLGAEVYDPASGTWTATGKMITPTKGARATLLRDNTVLVTGIDGAELYDPDSGTWTATGKMTQRHEYHAAVLLSDGKVFVAGGYVYDKFGLVSSGIQESAELYDPATGTWTATANMPGKTRHPITATLLPNGKVLVLGGYGGGEWMPPDLYDPAAGTWTATEKTVRPGTHYGSATLLPDGKVLVTLGPLDAELYDPETGSWSITDSMLHPAGTLLLDGTILVINGATGAAALYSPPGVSLPPNLPATPTPIPTPIPTPTPTPTPYPPEAGPVPPGGRTWTVTVVNRSSEPATLFVAEENEPGLLGRLVGSVTPNVVPPGATVKVTFLLPAKGSREWSIFVNPGPNDGPLIVGPDVPLAGQIHINEDGQPSAG